MFTKVLVANRGEIAVRIMRTLRELGIASVAIHSEPDTRALHVRVADEARCLGGEAAAENYLDIEAIIAAAKDTGAEAVHPGYGFLSENPAFPEALEKVGLKFIGPPADVLARVGDKLEARKLVQAVGVPVIPGSDVPASDIDEAARAADDLGYPVLVKAVAGGGGKGMRVVADRSALAEALREARSEAEAAFSRGTVYLERRIERPRHVEIQILADRAGQVVHLFERECSIQRRHQKIIEESPSPALDDDLRATMGDAAVKAARAAGYVNAGTVEFLLDRNKKFYFLEVNARLQVEHPVTEMVTGLDLVRLQVEIAAGLPLPFGQDAIVPRGHAIECRIYAEDPEEGFAPSPGRVSLLRPPSGPGLRHDEGIVSGSDVPRLYDPILAKLIAWAEDRPAARARMVRALKDYVILGVKTPIELMIDVLESAQFRAGETHTGLVDVHLERWKPSRDADELAILGAMAHQLAMKATGSAAAARPRHDAEAGWPSPWQTLGGWDLRRGRGTGR